MNLLSVGLNYTTAPLDLRAKVAFPPEQIGQAIAAARAWFGRHAGPATTSEAAILSTCNRTELYAARPAAGGIDAEIDATAHFLADYHKLPYAQLRPHLYALPRDNAVRHAFRVASGLDSMVLGEAQILGQMKDAVRLADAGGGLGTYLHQLFQRTFSVAKEVRTRTQIGAHSVSMAGAAVRMAQRIFPSIEGQRILFIGAGEMIELCLAHFAAHKPLSITVANRTLERAEALAQRYHGTAIGPAEVPSALAGYDIVISCTGASTPLIARAMVERALKARLRKPIFMVDLAVPRDIEADVGDLADVYLYTVDDLGAVVQSGRELRQAAVEHAEAIIETRVQAYMQWADQRAVVPIIQDLHELSETIRCAELQRARKMLARGDDVDSVLAALSQGLTAKFLNGPQQALHRSSGAQRAHLVQVLPQLFRASV
jgi:glutamyl-tRNA reductase